MKLVEIKTDDLEGKALDYAVAFYLNGTRVFYEAFGDLMLGRSILAEVLNGNISPSTNWLQGGVLIRSFSVGFDFSNDGYWIATTKVHLKGKGIHFPKHGSNHLIAACRAILAAEVGNFVKVPEEVTGDGR